MIINLQSNDERIGAPGKPPKRDVLGNVHQGDILSTYRFSDGRYVIIPAGQREPIQVKMEGASVPVPEAAPEGISEDTIPFTSRKGKA